MSIAQAQPLKPTGIRKAPGDKHEASTPSEDSHANKMFTGRGGVLKTGPGAGLQSSSANVLNRTQTAALVQKARKRTK